MGSTLSNRFFVALTVLAVVLAACGGGAKTTGQGSADMAPPDQQVLHLRLIGEPKSLDPHQTSSTTEFSITKQLFSPLFNYDEKLQVVPDLAAYGKVVAGGFPLACIAGPKAIMRHFDAALEGTPDYVWQAGTFNGNAIACAAGLATLAELRKPGMYERLFKTGTRLREGLAAAARKHGVPAQVSGEPPVFDIFFTDREVVDYRATLTADRNRIKRFNEELVRRKVVKAVNKIYVSLAHTDKDVDETLDIFDQALGVIAAGA